jgi:5-methylcytosine-specific restriction endonuclease McrA
MKGNSVKEAYRKSKEWKLRRKECIEQYGKVCHFCGLPISGKVIIHHIDNDPTKYTTSPLVPLDSSCHKTVTRFEKITTEKTMNKIDPLLRQLLSRVLLRFQTK